MTSIMACLKVENKNCSMDNGNKNDFHGQLHCENTVEGMMEFQKGPEECIKASRHSIFKQHLRRKAKCDNSTKI